MYDLVVIGGGSAGFSAAMTAVSYKKKVCIIEKGPFGGLCILAGCMPSKTLLHSARIAEIIKNSEKFGVKSKLLGFDVNKLVNRKDKIINGFADYRLKAVKKNKNIDLVMGEGKFVDDKSVKVGKRVIEGKNFLVSTGSKVFLPDVEGLKDSGYITSKEALSLKKMPKKMAVLGGGPVTLELAYYFFNMGVDVTVIQRSKHVMSDNDEDLAKVIEDSFRKKGIKVYTGTELKKVSKNKIEFLHGKKKKTVNFDRILAGLGRIPDVDKVGLKNIKIKLKDGRVVLNDYMQTSKKHIYVAGDANGIMQVVNVAVEQGRVIGETMFGKKEKINYHKFPMAVFTHPEVAWIGVTEKEAKEKKMNVDIGKLSYEDLGKAITYDETEGFIKFIVDKKSKEILGVSIVGYLASDIIHEAVPLLYNKNTLHDLVKMQHIHPTFGEIFSYLVEEML